MANRGNHMHRVIVKFSGENPQAFEYKHVEGALAYAQDKSLHKAEGFEKVTVMDSRTNTVVYRFVKAFLWDVK